jgi:hypothetical protein
VRVEYTRSFDKQFASLPEPLQIEAFGTIATFLDYYASRQFPKGLRVHKCGRFLSLSMRMNHRIFVIPVAGGVRFAFVGDHQDADSYLKK